jgi:hypothetical protein
MARNGFCGREPHPLDHTDPLGNQRRCGVAGTVLGLGGEPRSWGGSRRVRIFQTAVFACVSGMTRAMAVAVAMVASAESVSDASR